MKLVTFGDAESNGERQLRWLMNGHRPTPVRILGSLFALLPILGAQLQAQRSPPGTPGVPAGYTLLWTEDFANAQETVSGSTVQKRWSRFFQDGNKARKTAQILQLGGPGDPDGGEGVQGSLDGKVAAIQIPKGWNPNGSGAPASVWSNDFGKPREVFLRLRFKLAKNYKHWLGSKIGYVYSGLRGPVFIAITPEGRYTTQKAAETRPVKIKLGFQGVVPPAKGPEAGETTWNARPNRGTSAQWRLTRGQWDIIDLQLIGNTPGQPNGIARMWLNGVLILEYNDVGFFGGSVSTAPSFTRFAWTPTHDSFDKQAWEESSRQYLDEFSVWVKR